jgi:hypothetical protein
MDLFQHEMNESAEAGAWLEKYSKAFEGTKLPQTIDELLANAVAGTRNRLEADDRGPDAKRTRPAPDHFKPEFTSLEKMGFVMSGAKVQNPYDLRKVDLLQQIAENTRHLPRSTTSVMPDNRHPRDIVDPSPLISNIV